MLISEIDTQLITLPGSNCPKIELHLSITMTIDTLKYILIYMFAFCLILNSYSIKKMKMFNESLSKQSKKIYAPNNGHRYQKIILYYKNEKSHQHVKLNLNFTKTRLITLKSTEYKYFNRQNIKRVKRNLNLPKVDKNIDIVLKNYPQFDICDEIKKCNLIYMGKILSYATEHLVNETNLLILFQIDKIFKKHLINKRFTLEETFENRYKDQGLVENETNIKVLKNFKINSNLLNFDQNQSKKRSITLNRKILLNLDNFHMYNQIVNDNMKIIAFIQKNGIENITFQNSSRIWTNYAIINLIPIKHNVKDQIEIFSNIAECTTCITKPFVFTYETSFNLTVNNSKVVKFNKSASKHSSFLESENKINHLKTFSKKSLSLICTAFGNRIPTIFWYLNKTQISPNLKYHIFYKKFSRNGKELNSCTTISILKIQNLSQTDNGNYKCIAVNMDGKSKVSFKVEIKREKNYNNISERNYSNYEKCQSCLTQKKLNCTRNENICFTFCQNLKLINHICNFVLSNLSMSINPADEAFYSKLDNKQKMMFITIGILSFVVFSLCTIYLVITRLKCFRKNSKENTLKITKKNQDYHTICVKGNCNSCSKDIQMNSDIQNSKACENPKDMEKSTEKLQLSPFHISVSNSMDQTRIEQYIKDPQGATNI
ncbi:hypothetical protein A3Q56_02591 [Intoshia linei]|uniref:Ig-like domain-containing protein n=1 Tax=Intoshia linei TaxID=1819745 RepID=A0A177B5S7_9BILA|nr:hypothetical protein A3Q56_02591 [Intoshia linei]